MDIIVENLDIMNIFKKIYNMNIIENSLKSNGNGLDMSDNCKLKLQELLRKQING